MGRINMVLLSLYFSHFDGENFTVNKSWMEGGRELMRAVYLYLCGREVFQINRSFFIDKPLLFIGRM